MLHRKLLILLFLLLPVTAFADSVKITVQEALISAGTGEARTNEPVSVGIPVPASWTVESVDEFGITEDSVNPIGYQFRALKTDGDGYIRWVLVDATIPSVAANGTETFYLNNTGSGNSAGSDLAVDNDPSAGYITVYTGSGTYVIKKANFNLFHSATISGNQLVDPADSRGVYCTGSGGSPLYSSLNDDDSTAVIEENGPIKCCIKATGSLYNAEKTEFLTQYTIRFYFYKNLDRIRAQVVLKNASKDSVVHACIKEWGLSLGLQDFDAVRISTHDTESAQSVTSEDTISYYQAVGGSYYFNSKPNFVPRAPIPNLTGADPGGWNETGYILKKNADLIRANGTNAKYAYVDVRDSTTGRGCTVGMSYFENYWPKSIRTIGVDELDMCIYPPEQTHTFDLRPDDQSADYFIRYGDHETYDVMYSFHNSLNNAANDMQKFQLHLIGKATVDHYNECIEGIEPLQHFSARSFEQTYATYLSYTYSNGVKNRFPSNIASVYKAYACGEGSDTNQVDWPKSHFIQWLACDTNSAIASAYYMTGYNRIIYNTDHYVFHSDDYDSSTVRYGTPPATPHWNDMYRIGDNDDTVYVYQVNFDNEHMHMAGMPIWYYVTGDENIADSIDEVGEMLTRRNAMNTIEPEWVRVFSWWLYNLCIMYQWDGNSDWLNAATTMFDTFYADSDCDYGCTDPINPEGGCFIDKTGPYQTGDEYSYHSHLFIDADGCEYFPEFTDKGFIAGGHQAGWMTGISPTQYQLPEIKIFYINYLLYGAFLQYYYQLPDGVQKTLVESILDLMANAELEMPMYVTQEMRDNRETGLPVGTLYFPYGYRLDEPDLSYTQWEALEWAEYPLMWGLSRGLNYDYFWDIAAKDVKRNFYIIASSYYPPFNTMLYELEQIYDAGQPPPPPPEEEPGEADIDIVNDRWFDTTSLTDFGNSAVTLFGASTNEEKAIAMWRAMYQTTYSQLSGDHIWQELNYGTTYGYDPMKTVNIYGVGHCDLLTRVMQSTWDAVMGSGGADYDAIKHTHLGHTIAEIYWPDDDLEVRGHVFDCSQKLFVYDRSADHIASWLELKEDWSLLARPSNNIPIPTVIGTTARGTVLWGWWSRDTAEDLPTQYPVMNTTKNLHTNETCTLMFGNDGKPEDDVFINWAPTTDAAHGSVTIDYGNGIWEYTLGYDGDTTVYSFRMPYIVSFVDPIGEDTGENAQTFEVRYYNSVSGTYGSYTETLTAVEGYYDFDLRVSGGAANPTLSFKVWTQLNPQALPRLLTGTNTITVSGDVDDNVTLSVQYNWTDTEGEKSCTATVISPPYSFEIDVAGTDWTDVTNTSIVLSAAAREVGDANAITEPDGTTTTGTQQTLTQAISTVDLIGSVSPAALDTVNNYITALQAQIAAQEGIPTDNDNVTMSAASSAIRAAYAGLMEHGTAASGSIDDIIAVVKADRSNSMNKLLGLQCVYQIIGSNAKMFALIDDFLAMDSAIEWGGDEGAGWTHYAYIFGAAQCASILWDIGDAATCGPYKPTILLLETAANVDAIIHNAGYEVGIDIGDLVSLQWNGADGVNRAFVTAYDEIPDPPEEEESSDLINNGGVIDGLRTQ